MKYELAKALKDAGFPQRRDRYDRHYIVKTDTWLTTETAKQLKKPRGSVIDFDEMLVHIPDLSELIDACGDNFIGLHRTDNGEWRCFYRYCGDRESSSTTNDFPTPEEAVANVWLVLRGKSLSMHSEQLGAESEPPFSSLAELPALFPNRSHRLT